MLRLFRHAALVSLMLLLALAGMTFYSNRTAMAAVKPSVPPTHSKPGVYSRSWYIHDPDVGNNYQKLYQLGASDGALENTCNSYLAILNFGQVGYANQYGTYYFNKAAGYPFISDNQIAAAVEQYATGWFYATGTCPSLRIAIGTNNSNECPHGSPCSTYYAGYAWGNMVNTVNSWLSARGFSPQIDAAGADDIETDLAHGWDTPGKTFPFLQGFYNASGAHNTFLYDFGIATVNSVWTDAEVYAAAWGDYFDVPLPEIYTSQNTLDWATLYHHHTNMVFYGTLTECASINSGYPGCSNPSGEYSPLNAWGAFEYQLGTSAPLESAASNNLCQPPYNTPHCYT